MDTLAPVIPIPSQPRPEEFKDTARLLLALHATPEMLLACCGQTPGFTAIAGAMRELSP